ncbi:hypothetical protein CFOL_v3_13302, partial [Cephalotus follicularis]
KEKGTIPSRFFVETHTPKIAQAREDVQEITTTYDRQFDKELEPAIASSCQDTVTSGCYSQTPLSPSKFHPNIMAYVTGGMKKEKIKGFGNYQHARILLPPSQPSCSATQSPIDPSNPIFQLKVMTMIEDMVRTGRLPCWPQPPPAVPG